MKRFLSFIQKYPLFLGFLPIFFVLHALLDYAHPSIIKDAAQLIVFQILLAGILCLLSHLYYKSWKKAALFSFSLLAFNFFFANLYTFLKKIFNYPFFLKYIFVIPVCLILFILLFIYLKKTKSGFQRTFFYLNSVLGILILVDVINLFSLFGQQSKKTDPSPTVNFLNCDSCSNPDIYLIISDEYAGKTQLQDMFSFRNDSFESELQKRNFHIIPESHSNYRTTVYSMASLFNMNYVNGFSSEFISYRDMLLCQNIINDNNCYHFFKNRGYEFYNYSFFRFAQKPNPIMIPFFLTKKGLIMSRTFINTAIKDLWFNFASNQKIERVTRTNFYNDGTVDSLLRLNVISSSSAPKFVYAHLMMPHSPYFISKPGRLIEIEKLNDTANNGKSAYLAYLEYANQKILSLIDYIQSNNKRPAMILFLSDHGYRQFIDRTLNKYQFSNIAAINMPSGNYNGFYTGLSNVNLFRVILNSQFGQRLPMLRDSTSFIWEKSELSANATPNF